MKCNFVTQSRRKCRRPVKLTADQAKKFCWAHLGGRAAPPAPPAIDVGLTVAAAQPVDVVVAAAQPVDTVRVVAAAQPVDAVRVVAAAQPVDAVIAAAQPVDAVRVVAAAQPVEMPFEPFTFAAEPFYAQQDDFSAVESPAYSTESTAYSTESTMEDTESSAYSTESTMEETESSAYSTESTMEETESTMEETESTMEEGESSTYSTESSTYSDESSTYSAESSTYSDESSAYTPESSLEQTESSLEQTESSLEQTEDEGTETASSCCSADEAGPERWHDADAPAPVTFYERLRSVLTTVLDMPNGHLPVVRPAGLGAKATEDELYVAGLLTGVGFTAVPPIADPADLPPGFYYLHRPNGAQQAPNFLLLGIAADAPPTVRSLAIKATKSWSLMLNDGFFEPGTVYILLYDARQQAIVGLGEHIATDAERRAYIAQRAAHQRINGLPRRTENLRLYTRCSNTYSCKHFNDELRGLYLGGV
jgi:hypothetical protein